MPSPDVKAPSVPTDATRYRPAAHVMACPFGEGTALLHGGTNTYFSLDPVGATVWSAMTGEAGAGGAPDGVARSLDELCDAVAGEFDVDAATCRPDIEALLQALLAHGLCEAAPDAEARSSVAGVAPVPEPA